jgi:membrane-bound serine protease (ClpP class)
VLLSVVVTAVGTRIFLRSRAARRLMLADRGTASWKAADVGLGELVGKEGRTLTPLRPAGMVEIDERRIDVVSDSEFLGAGVRVRVVEVEGNRVVVEPATETELATREGSP